VPARKARKWGGRTLADRHETVSNGRVVHERVDARREARASRPASRGAREVGTAYREEDVHALGAPRTAVWASGASASAVEDAEDARDNRPRAALRVGGYESEKLIVRNEAKGNGDAAEGEEAEAEGRKRRRRPTRSALADRRAGVCALLPLPPRAHGLLVLNALALSLLAVLGIHRICSPQWSSSPSSSSRRCLCTYARA
jgi:hypothetical protein